ncbi:MAG: NUDIX domain-containing protein [Patescibacteria group bacterium]|jgi:hypothetical protein
MGTPVSTVREILAILGPDHISTGAVIRQVVDGSERVFLMQAEDGTTWQLPRMRRIPGETLESTLVRGIRHAAGLEALPIRYLGHLHHVSEVYGETIIEQTHYYLADCDCPSDEQPPGMFIPFSEALQRLEASPLVKAEGRILQMATVLSPTER